MGSRRRCNDEYFNSLPPHSTLYSLRLYPFTLSLHSLKQAEVAAHCVDGRLGAAAMALRSKMDTVLSRLESSLGANEGGGGRGEGEGGGDGPSNADLMAKLLEIQRAMNGRS